MNKLQSDIHKYGGLLSTGELLALDHWRERIKIAHIYGTIVRVRRGWYALPGESPPVMRAWRVGGRLACASALAYLGGQPQPAELHVEVRANAAHLRHPDDARRRLAASDPVVVHWTRGPTSGDLRAVDRETAVQQLQRCGGEQRVQAASSESASRIV